MDAAAHRSWGFVVSNSLGLPFTINGASVSDPYDEHEKFRVVHFVDDSVVTDADAKESVLTGERLRSVGTGVVS